MKKSIRIIALAMVAVMLCMALASCGGPMGEYGNDDLSIKFSGSKYAIIIDEKEMVTGKFEMGKDDEGNKTITFTPDEAEEEGKSIFDMSLSDIADALTKELLRTFEGTVFYNSGKDDNGNYIEIGAAKLYKK